MSAEVPADPALDADGLAAWLATEELAPDSEPLELRFISGGSQNEIFEVRCGDLHCVLRKPPTSAPSQRDKGIIREWRIIDALRGTDVPHAPAIALCEDPTVLGRPFYLMGYVDGWSPVSTPTMPAPFDTDMSAKAELAYQVVEGVVRMGAVDWQTRGLGDLGQPDGYHERQVERWTRFLERIKGRDLPGLEEATKWLASHRPLDFVPGLMHGDYQLANVMFRHGAPGRLAAIVDWEMGTIGDSKLDLAWVLQGWPEDTTAASNRINTSVDITGMPGRTALLEYYTERSGRQLDDFDYYIVLARWKLAIVLEQGYQRAGNDEKLLAFGPIVLDLMARAAEFAETSDYPATS